MAKWKALAGSAVKRLKVNRQMDGHTLGLTPTRTDEQPENIMLPGPMGGSGTTSK